MNMKSMRLRLPLTYAAIALLATLVSGSILILTLRDYYAGRERAYMQQRAVAIQLYLSQMLQDGLPVDVLQAQLKNLAFFTQARLRLFDQNRKLLADTGNNSNQDLLTVVPLTRSNLFYSSKAGFSQEPPPLPPIIKGSAPDGEVKAGLGEQGLEIVIISGQGVRGVSASAPVTNTLALISSVPNTVTFNSFDLGVDGADGRKSDQIVNIPATDAGGNLIGMLELSEGPAFGGAIVSSVVRAWLLAGLVAVVLAGVAGWLVSRQMTYPLTALAQVTQELAGGDLSVRADPGAAGEFGELGSSFNRMAERIEGTVAYLRKFASDAAHELKTPLTALVTELELALEEGAPSQERDGHLQRARGQVQRLERLMDNLLDLSRLETGSQEGAPHPVNLTEVLQEAGENFASQAEQHELDFDLQLPSEPLVVMGYPEQLRRAMANLLDNAVKFTLPGGRVQLRLRALEAGAEICVSDTGIGLLPEDLEQVFQRFHRGRNASAYNGSGLGLAIVQAIAQAHGGQVWAENNPGGGARFIIRLPKG
jgi:signal transduction histidine kinase